MPGHGFLSCGVSRFVLAAGLLLPATGFAQGTQAPAAVSVAPNLLRVEGRDAGTGVHYVRLILSQPETPGDAKAPPRFTVECTDDGGKHEMNWLVSFGGIGPTAFIPPFRPTKEVRFPDPMPSVLLKMDFEGYMKWKPVTRAWSLLPTGELRYRNPGIESPNLDSLRSFLPYLRVLPGLRIGYAHAAPDGPRELLFATRPLLDEMAKTPLCQ